MERNRTISNITCERVEVIRQRLETHCGAPHLTPNSDPLGELVLTILSQHTTDRSSGAAYAELRSRYPTWDSVRALPIDELAAAIRMAGLPMQKARAIQSALGAFDLKSLDSLVDLPVPEARARLTAVRGVGDKTASCVLLFALGMPAQPVDTHIERVSNRLGIGEGSKTATGLQYVFEHCLPASGQAMFAFHINMVRHGREVCQARVPRCGLCVLTDVCDFYKRAVATNG
jgi:endonuclease-3